MVSSLFHRLRGHTGLETKLRARVSEFTTGVVILTDGLKVAFYHINIVIIVFMIDTRISDDTDSELVETVGGLFTLFLDQFSLIGVVGLV